MIRQEFEDLAFEEELRSLLHRAADPIQPDPDGWRRVNRRIGRGSTAVRAGGLVLAGAAAAIAAVTVLPSLGEEQVQLAPAGVATQPVTPPSASPTVSAAATADLDGAPDGPEAGGILVSDGNSIHVTDLDGQVLFTPAQGEGTSAITDVDVRGGTTDDFTMAYRIDPAGDGVECGDVSWTHVVGPGNNVAGGGLYPDVDTTTTGDCLGSPVFDSDGRALAWIAFRADGGVALQTIGWTDEGPVTGSLATFPLDLPASAQPSLVELSIDAVGGGFVAVRLVEPTGTAIRVAPLERQADDALALTGEFGEPVLDADGFNVVDRDGPWQLVDIGLALEVQLLGADGQVVSRGSVTSDWAPWRPAGFNALGPAALTTIDQRSVLTAASGDADAIQTTELPMVRSATLLARPLSPSAPTTDPGTAQPVGPTD